MIFVTFLFIMGLILGSFINAFLWRYETKKTLGGRSMCPKCNHQLAWFENIPLISWLMLSGRCRYCKKSISTQYPIIEATTAILFALAGLYSASGIYLQHITKTMIEFGLIFQARYLTFGLLEIGIILAITTILVIISVYDYKNKLIPNGFNLTFILLCLSFLIVTSLWPDQNIKKIVLGLASATAAFLFFYAFVFFSKETWMGGGDAKMAIGIGLLLGPAGTFFAILVASITGSIFGIATILIGRNNTKGKKMNHEVPFGPFLAIGTYVSLIFGPQIIDWYAKIVLGI